MFLLFLFYKTANSPQCLPSKLLSDLQTRTTAVSPQLITINIILSSFSSVTLLDWFVEWFIQSDFRGKVKVRSFKNILSFNTQSMQMIKSKSEMKNDTIKEYWLFILMRRNNVSAMEEPKENT